MRIPLIAALNHISTRQIKQALEILRSIQPHCIYDEDKAAWTFFVGLCFEMAGKQEQMLRWYEDAGKFGHRFYLPYLKIAKAAHNAAQFQKALQYYAAAISCLQEMREDERDELILGSAYTNLTSCLTMLYRYGEDGRPGRLRRNIPGSRAPPPPGRFSAPQWATGTDAMHILRS